MFKVQQIQAISNFVIGYAGIGNPFPLREYVDMYIEREGLPKNLMDSDYRLIRNEIVAAKLAAFTHSALNTDTGKLDDYYLILERGETMKHLHNRTIAGLERHERRQKWRKEVRELAPIAISSLAIILSSISTIYSVRSYNLAVMNNKSSQTDSMRKMTEQERLMQIELNKRISYSCIDSLWRKVHQENPKGVRPK